MKKIFLLPGLDGTGISLDLLKEDLTLRGYAVQCMHYPARADWKYEDYAAQVCKEIEQAVVAGERFAVFAESFGGPMVPYLYQHFKGSIAAIVFCATFVKNPIYAARAMKIINKFLKPSNFPSFAYSISFLGLNPKAETVEVFKKIKSGSSEDVVRSRINQVLSIDDSNPVLQSFTNIPVPILYIQARYDMVVLPNGYMGIKKLNPHTVLEIINSAHLVSHAESAKVGDKIGNFLTNIAF